MNKIEEITLATTNRGKLNELRKLLQGCPIALRSLDEFGSLDDFEETGDTFAENARQKALHYSKLLNRLVLADDSGLQVDALGGAPGVCSARFAGIEGAHRDQANNQKLLELLAEIPTQKRTGRFCCFLCLAGPTEIIIEVEGFLEGVIISTPRGENGFGYDPVFFLPDRNKTVAELTNEEKNAISHRGQALRKLLFRLTTMF